MTLAPDRSDFLGILLTGATGFIGSRLIARLLVEPGFAVRGVVRRESVNLPSGIERIVMGELAPDTDWPHALRGVNVVVHLAARVHVMHDMAADALTEYRKVNVAATVNLARQAARAGVKRFVFLSSLKVNGESGAFTESFTPAPQNAYGISKYEAELELFRIAAETGLEIVVIRPPLVYGPGVKANFRALMRALARGIPLPLGAIHNRRSLLALDNLVDFILTCIKHPAAANEIFLVSDGEDLSTTDLIRRLANAMGRPARLIPLPAPLLIAAATLLAKGDIAQRLLGSLQVDISKARQVLGWRAPISVDEGLRRAARSS